jgi:hypothetical protein
VKFLWVADPVYSGIMAEVGLALGSKAVPEVKPVADGMLIYM